MLAALHGKTDVIHQAEVRIGSCGQRLLEKSHNLIIGAAQDHCVIHICCHTFQTVHEDFDNGADIFVDMLGIDAVSISLCYHAVQIICRLPGGNFTRNRNACGCFSFFLQLVTLLDQTADTRCIKIYIGNGGEETFDGETVDFGVSADFVGIERQTFQAVKQMILQCCYLGIFTAYAGNIATCSICSLLTLITKHFIFLLGVM